jgi:hypothetical protein
MLDEWRILVRNELQWSPHVKSILEDGGLEDGDLENRFLWELMLADPCRDDARKESEVQMSFRDWQMHRLRCRMARGLSLEAIGAQVMKK